MSHPAAEGARMSLCPDDITSAFDDLARAIVHAHDFRETLGKIGHIAVTRLASCADASVTVAMPDGSLTTWANTSERVLVADRLQYDAGEGPSIDAVRGAVSQY